jgi:hypothetical protein
MAPRSVSIPDNPGPNEPPDQNKCSEQNYIDSAAFSQTMLLPEGHPSISRRPDPAASVGNLPVEAKSVRKLPIHRAILL